MRYIRCFLAIALAKSVVDDTLVLVAVWKTRRTSAEV